MPNPLNLSVEARETDARAPYETPQLEVHASFQFVTGTSLGIGALSVPENGGDL